MSLRRGSEVCWATLCSLMRAWGCIHHLKICPINKLINSLMQVSYPSVYFIMHLWENIPELLTRFSNEYEASTLSSTSLSKFSDLSNWGTRIEHAMDFTCSSPTVLRKLHIHDNVTRLTRAKLGMALAMESERAASNFLLPLLNNAVAAFLCQFSVASSSSF